MPSWSRVYDALPEDEQARIKAYLHDQTRTSISDLELRAVRWLMAGGYQEGVDFTWQARKGRMRVDLMLPDDRAIELYGCGYHQCPTCHPRPWWPGVLEKDAARTARLMEQHGVREVQVVWNHEDVEERLQCLLSATT